MLSRVMGRGLVRRSMQTSKMVKPGQYVCFCGCKDGNHSGSSLINMSMRGFQGHLGLDSTQKLVPQEYKEADQVSLWKDVQAKQENALVLKTSDEIEQYVLSLVKGYFRTTKKAKVDMDCLFSDHGLDSLDVIELVIQVEDELGYLIDAEKLELFSKPKHFVNFITQMEAYKTEHKRLPHEGIYEDFEVSKHFPGLPSLGH